MTLKDDFNLRGIIESSIIELQEYPKVYTYLLELSEESLSLKLTDSLLSEIANELLSHILEGK